MEVSLSRRVGSASCRLFTVWGPYSVYVFIQHASASTYSMELYHIKTHNLSAKPTNYNQVLVTSDSLRKQLLEETAISEKKFWNLIANILTQFTCYLLKLVVATIPLFV